MTANSSRRGNAPIRPACRRCPRMRPPAKLAHPGPKVSNHYQLFNTIAIVTQRLCFRRPTPPEIGRVANAPAHKGFPNGNRQIASSHANRGEDARRNHGSLQEWPRAHALEECLAGWSHPAPPAAASEVIRQHSGLRARLLGAGPHVLPPTASAIPRLSSRTACWTRIVASCTLRGLFTGYQ